MLKHKAKIVLIAIPVILALVVVYSVVGPPRRLHAQASTLSSVHPDVDAEFYSLRFVNNFDYASVKYSSRGDYLLVVGTATPASLAQHVQASSSATIVADGGSIDMSLASQSISDWQRDFQLSSSILHLPPNLHQDGVHITGHVGARASASYRMYYSQSTGYFVLFVDFHS